MTALLPMLWSQTVPFVSTSLVRAVINLTIWMQFQVYVFVNGSPATKPFETLIPLTLRSCYANAGNTVLPGYFEERLPVYSSLASDAPVSTPDRDHDL
jgi:hypothetical protein